LFRKNNIEDVRKMDHGEHGVKGVKKTPDGKLNQK
jgi:hypothetical protein